MSMIIENHKKETKAKSVKKRILDWLRYIYLNIIGRLHGN